MKFLLEKEETQRLYFRRIEIGDFNTWLNFFKDPTSFEHWNTIISDPIKECENWYKKQFDRYEKDLGGMNALIDKKSGGLIGHAGLLVQEVDGLLELEVGYSLLSVARNKGLATEAAKKCCEVSFNHNYAESLISIISLTNTPSANVALKNGLTIEKQTHYQDNSVNIFRISKSQWQNVRT